MLRIRRAVIGACLAMTASACWSGGNEVVIEQPQVATPEEQQAMDEMQRYMQEQFDSPGGGVPQQR